MRTRECLLIDNALDGDTSAFAELVRLHRSRLFGAMVCMTGCSAEAEDIVQDAFVGAFSRLHQFRRISSFYTWLYRIAVNRSVDRRRTRLPMRRIDLEMDDLAEVSSGVETLPSRLELQEQCQCVQQALAQLSESDRAILTLREYEGRDYSTISDILGLAIGTVKSRLHRARGRWSKQVRIMIADSSPALSETVDTEPKGSA